MNKLKLNESKAKLLQINMNNDSVIKINNETIEKVNRKKYLGFIIDTYKHNWSLQPFNQDYGLASHTTYVVCFYLVLEWRNLQFNIFCSLLRGFKTTS